MAHRTPSKASLETVADNAVKDVAAAYQNLRESDVRMFTEKLQQCIAENAKIKQTKNWKTWDEACKEIPGCKTLDWSKFNEKSKAKENQER